jgi:hypothetical protein
MINKKEHTIWSDNVAIFSLLKFLLFMREQNFTQMGLEASTT